MLTKAKYKDLFKQAVNECIPIRRTPSDTHLPTRRMFNIAAPENRENPLFYTYLHGYLRNGHTAINYTAIVNKYWFDGTPAKEITLELIHIVDNTALVQVSVSKTNAKPREMINFKVIQPS